MVVSDPDTMMAAGKVHNLGALIIGKGFWGPFYYNYNKFRVWEGIRAWGLGFGA